jgi:signal transduction histidine kinase
MLLRSSSDVAVVRAAPWLTTQRALLIAVATATVILLALIVVAVLARRQIAQREEARKLAEVEFAAMLAERNRLARELHDTIAQELNAVSMQMELAKNSAKTGTVEDLMPHLVTAHGIVRSCLAEARESIWDMRSHILEKTDLLGALRAVAEQMSAGLGCTIRTRAHGKPRRLAPMIENNLLRIGQEAVSNALKHAQARVVDLEITFDVSCVRLVVCDDGRGFDPAAERPDGHFGLRGMKERVEQMQGELSIRRVENGGTRVEVAVNSLES